MGPRVKREDDGGWGETMTEGWDERNPDKPPSAYCRLLLPADLGAQ